MLLGASVAVALRDLTIRQRWRPWKRRWKIDFPSFSTFSRLSQFALLLKRREFWLQLKRGDRVRVQTEMVEFIALPFPFSSKLKIWSFHVVVVQGQQRNVQKSVMTCRVVVLLIKPIALWHSHCRRYRSFVRSLQLGRRRWQRRATRILQGFTFSCKLALLFLNSTGITKFKHETKYEMNTGLSSKKALSSK